MKQFSLAPLKYKIVTAFLSGCVALLSAYFISNYVFNETFGTLDSFSDLNPKLVLIERLFPEINRLDKAQRLEALRSPIQSMKNFQNSSVKILNMLDSLDLLCNGDTLEVSRIKQMRKLLSDRNNTFINYLELYRKLIRSSSISRDLKKISEDLSVTLKRADSTIVRTSVKTTTTTSIVDIPEKDIKPVKRSFFKKLFAREKTAPKESKPAQRKVITQKIVQQTDTYNIARKDNFSEDLDKTIESIEAKQRVRGSKLLQEEIKLATANAHFIDQLQALLQQVQNDEIREVRERTGSLENIFNEAYAKAGSVIFVFLVLTLLLIALMFIDISKSDKYKKQLLLEKEKAQELEQVKQRFLSNMSHELRTPLQAILGFSEQLKKNDGLQEKALQVIETSSAHLLHLVNEVLDYNRIVSDKFTLSKDEFELANVLGEIADVIDAECEKKGIKFNFHCLVHHNQLVLGDSFRLKQILYNLLSNAVKFTESGMVSLWVKTLWEEGKNITVSFEIKDTGIGMTNEEIGRVFNHFEQANARVQKKYGGSGLGLSIVKELVELQNGLLSVDSEIGKGSCFTVHLTYEVADEVRQKATYPIAVSKEDFYKCVLVIDDDVCVRELCSVIFQRHHINHTFAYSLPDILKKADEYLIDLVLIDIRMPEINGVEVLKCLKNKMNSHVKFIAMTAYAFPDERASILFAGFDGILVKPFVETDLLKHVTKSHITPTITQLSTKHESPGGLANIIGDDKELYDKTFEIFSEQILIDLEELECALKKNDLDGISFSCHRLYSKLAQMGLNVPAKEILFTESCIKKNKICKLTISEYYGLKDSVVSALDKMKAFDLI